jgi:hypothetical protein
MAASTRFVCPPGRAAHRRSRGAPTGRWLNRWTQHRGDGPAQTFDGVVDGRNRQIVATQFAPVVVPGLVGFIGARGGGWRHQHREVPQHQHFAPAAERAPALEVLPEVGGISHEPQGCDMQQHLEARRPDIAVELRLLVPLGAVARRGECDDQADDGRGLLAQQLTQPGWGRGHGAVVAGRNCAFQAWRSGDADSYSSSTAISAPGSVPR